MAPSDIGRHGPPEAPVQTLFDYLEESDTLDSFPKGFPTVCREHAVAVLELAKDSVLAHADSA